MDRLNKQNKSFAASMAGASSKFAKKVGASASTSAYAPQKPVKREAGDFLAVPPAQKVVFSQPQETGKGTQIQTQVVYAVEYLKGKMDTSMNLGTILSYLSLSDAEKTYKDALRVILSRHPQVDFDPTAYGGEGSYRFKPKHNIRSEEDLLGALQGMVAFRGLDVKELKEGWPSIDKTLHKLEQQHKVLVTKHKKDSAPRFVYHDDPTLYFTLDKEFKQTWLQLKLTDLNKEQLTEAVVKAHQIPTNKVGKVDKGPQKKVEKKARKARRNGKTTNKHMVGMLKDYSHLRK